MASSLKSKKIYDVFLSFRGAELRNNFVSHLYQALHQIGIYTFLDSEELKKGDKISMLMKAIEESRIALIVFSKNYTSSKWCLKEVTKIMECKEQNNLTVLPVFYKVEPREVRGRKESYERALTEHEFKFGEDSEEVKIWKKVLSEAGSLSGWHLNDENESELIQRIVKGISTRLNQTPLHVAKHPTGIDSQVVKLKLMLHLESNDDVVMVGLWGQGGIGKSALARALYNAIFRQFEGSCLLANVREAQNSKHLISLQETMLLEILSLQQKLEVSSVERGINLIQHKLCHKKVLLILDDVDDLCQLNALAGKDKWFGNGSRIIVTTRDNHLLTYLGIDQDHVYEVRELNNNDARELFSKHAFLTHQNFRIRTDLVDGVLNHAKGLPLALEVLGSFLCGRREYEWESALDDISTAPMKGINDVLKISYNGLEPKEKEIFLHIACLFKGRNIEYVKKVLDSCDLKAIGLQILVDRALIRIESGNIQMHDSIQLMGMDIVNQESDDPGRRSILWQYDDVVDVLSSNMENCAVKAILLKSPKPTEMCINLDAFTKMTRLKLLILHNVHNSFQGHMCLPNGLRWFEWIGCARQIPKFSSVLKKLGLNMRGGNITGVHNSVQGHICLPNGLRWFEWIGCARQIPKFSSVPKKLLGLNMRGGNITGAVKQFKDFQNLKYINFSYCKSLVRMPDLSCTPNLEELDLRNCKDLVEAHKSITYLNKLQVLNLEECSELSVFPNELQSKNLRVLNFKNCTKFERFPDILHKLEALKELFLERTAIKGLPASIENLVSLECMYLSHCKNLTSLPSSIYTLPNLEDLALDFCTNLIGFPKYDDSTNPCMMTKLSNLHRLNLLGCNLSEVDFLENLSCSPFLTSLALSSNNLTSLPTSINKRHRLFALLVKNCHQLREIPELPPFLNVFRADNCESLQNYGDLTSIDDFVCRGLTMADISSHKELLEYSIVLPQEEMPEWVHPIEKESVSFMTSKDLYDKFFGFVFCVALNKHHLEGGKSYKFVSHVNGQQINELVFEHNPLELDHIQLLYLTPSKLWRVVDFDQFDGSHVKFDVTISSKYMKKWGCRMLCKQLGDNLKVMLQDNQLIDPALLYEIDHESTYSGIESLFMYEDGSIETNRQKHLQDYQKRMEKYGIFFRKQANQDC